MPRGSVPTPSHTPPVGVLPNTQEPQAPTVSIPPLPSQRVGVVPGPMGRRAAKPEMIAQLMRLQQDLRSAQQAGTGPISVGQPQAEEQVVTTPPTVVPPELPKAPPVQLTVGQPPAVAAKEEAEAEAEAEDTSSQTREMPSPMSATAKSGAESRLFDGLSHDPEFMNTIIWKASPERRKLVEQRCKPIDWDSLTTSYEVRQEVPIWVKPKPITVLFRTMTADDEYLTRRILTERYLRSGSEYEIGSVLTAAAASVIAINDQVLPIIPSVLAKDGTVEKRQEVMEERIKLVLKMPYTLLTDIAINYSWFTMRMAAALKDGEVGNG